MNEVGTPEWAEGLHRFAAACRAARALPDRGTLTLGQERLCRLHEALWQHVVGSRQPASPGVAVGGTPS